MRRVTRCSQSLLFTFLLISVLTFPVVAAPAPVRLAALDTDRYTHAVDQAITWIKGQQEADGSFPTGWGHAAGMTLDAIFAGVAAGEDVSEWRAGVGDPSAVEYLESVVNEYAVDAGRTGKLVAGIVAAGEDPEAFGGEDLVARLKAYDDGTGAYAADANGQAWAMIGLAAAREAIGAGAITHLEGMQQPDDGWGTAWGSDVDTTSIVLEALIGAGVSVDADTVVSGLGYIKAQQGSTGGFTGWGSVSPNSTAYGTQAIVAAEQNPFGAAWRADAGTPVDDLMSFQIASGAFALEAGGDANLFATVQAVPALLGKAFPMAGAVPAIADALDYLRGQQMADGSFGTNSSRALMALAAVDENGRAWKGSSDLSLVGYLEWDAAFVKNVGQAGRLAAALAMAHENPSGWTPCSGSGNGPRESLQCRRHEPRRLYPRCIRSSNRHIRC